MSILAKKGQRALTHKRQKRHARDLLTRRRWKAWRTFVHHTEANSRSPMEKAFQGIVGQTTTAQRDERLYKAMISRR